MSDVLTQQAGLRSKLQRTASIHWVHWLVVIFSLLLTLGAWYFSKSQVEEKTSERFRRESTRVVSLVIERMERYENVLWGAVAYLDANKSGITPVQWRDYADSLQIDARYPGINGIGVIHNIQKDELDAYLNKVRISRPEFTVRPQHQEREHWPITYVEPVALNAKAVGLDMAFETNRYTGILRARDSGMGILTGPIVLVQDSKKTPGFLFYTPFYKDGLRPETLEERRKNIIGVTYAPFIMHKLMKGTLDRSSRHVGVKISDQNDVLFDDSENSSDLGLASEAVFHSEKTIDIYGRSWKFSIWSDKSFTEASENSQPLMILVGGIVIDSLLLTLFFFLSRANRMALNYADKMTEDLQAESLRLEKTNSDLEQFAYVASHDLKAPLRGIGNVAKWLEEDLHPVLHGTDEITDELKELVISYLAQLFKRAHRLENLLESILSYSRVGALAHSVELVDVRNSVKEINLLLNVEERFDIHEVDLPQMYMEKTPFEIVLRNLISNSIKHHDQERGHIWISSREEDGFVEFTVTDDGPGVPEEFKEKIFELFSTLRSRDEVEGSGMGLATIRKIVEGMNGRIWYAGENDPRGSVFTFTWPKTQEPPKNAEVDGE